ncbi:MAG: hypothetical protein JWQ32_2553 [Marmoricola sp.]|nr:hypothetical protein [Marmoricola sp.]
MATRMKAALAGLREELRFEPVPQRLRISLDGSLVAETTDAMLVWEPRCVVPSYAVPLDAVVVPMTTSAYEPPDLSTAPALITPDLRGVLHLAPGRTVTLLVDGVELDQIGYRFDDGDLAEHVLLRWDPFTWTEETDTMLGHPQDIYSRILTRASDRKVAVSYRGTRLAESTRAVLLLETGLPPRWYLPREDLEAGLFVDSEHHTTCAYKGVASYLSLRDDPRGRDLGWFYPNPLHDAAPVRDLVCFWSERTDLVLDGVAVPRPESPFARPEEDAS